MTSGWQYDYIDLHRSTANAERAFDQFAAQMKDAGENGWEAVGEIRVSCDASDSSDAAIRLMMLKRPLS
jgi:hypothetical protein